MCLAGEKECYRSAEGSHAEVVEVCEKRDAAVLRGVVKGHLHCAEVIILPAADAAQHVVCQPPLLAVPWTVKWSPKQTWHGAALLAFCAT